MTRFTILPFPCFDWRLVSANAEFTLPENLSIQNFRNRLQDADFTTFASVISQREQEQVRTWHHCLVHSFDEERETKASAELIRKAVIATRLIRSTRIDYSHLVHCHEQDGRLVVTGMSIRGRPNIPLPGEGLEDFTAQDVEALAHIFERYLATWQLQPGNNSLTRALILYDLSSSQQYLDITHLFRVIALESMFSDPVRWQSNVTIRRIAFFASPLLPEIKSLQEQLDHLFQLRHKFAHGEGVPDPWKAPNSATRPIRNVDAKDNTYAHELARLAGKVLQVSLRRIFDDDLVATFVPKANLLPYLQTRGIE